MLLFLLACEPMVDPGPVFEPKAQPVAAADPLQEVFREFDEQSVASEALDGGDIAPGTAVGAEVPVGEMDTVGGAPAVVAATAVIPVVPTVASTVSSQFPIPAALRLDPWPVRVLATLPGAQPPRAVFGLPSGEERVVSPGTMLADQGLVVMSISGNQVQVAQVKPAGDHAEITTLVLAAQYPTP